MYTFAHVCVLRIAHDAHNLHVEVQRLRVCRILIAQAEPMSNRRLAREKRARQRLIHNGNVRTRQRCPAP